MAKRKLIVEFEQKEHDSPELTEDMIISIIDLFYPRKCSIYLEKENGNDTK